MKEFSFQLMSDTDHIFVLATEDQRVQFSSNSDVLIEPQVRRLFHDKLVRIVEVSGIRLQYAGVVRSISNLFAEVRIGDLYTFESTELLSSEQYSHKVEVDIESRKLQIEYGLNIVFLRATEQDQYNFLIHLLNRLNIKSNVES